MYVFLKVMIERASFTIYQYLVKWGGKEYTLLPPHRSIINAISVQYVL